MNADVLVIGSANLDYIVKVAVPPKPGETVLAKHLVKHPGGKGANQSVAAARMGARVRFIGCVGDDEDGAALLRDLRTEGVDTIGVEIAAHTQTGLALVSVFDSGENSITVVPGANFALQSSRIRRAVAALNDSDTIVVMQAEVKNAIIDAAVVASRLTARTRFVLNLAPFRPVATEVLAVCDPLVVNQSEAAAMVGYDIDSVAAALRAVTELRTIARSAVITLGAKGAVWAEEGFDGSVPAPPVSAVVDTTGAGDAFVGALAATLAEGASLEAAVGVGVRAGSFAVERFGAQSSYPMRQDLDSAPAARV
ncbi:MAG: ribokinase [Mycetocola sp.]